jgi:FkbM family methyltransferase
MNVFCRRRLQELTILFIRPYVVREYPGWGKLYAFFADHRRDWLWRDAPIKTIRDKKFDIEMHLDLSKWSDRANYFLGRWYDLEIQLFAADIIRPGDVAVDVGANRGEFTLIASRLVGDDGKVVCFEPNPQCLESLDREVASNNISNVVIHRLALGSTDEELTLSVPILQSYYGTFSKSAFANDETYDIKTQVKRGDALLANEWPVLIKIDVEGFECNVLAGLAETISRCHPAIITEVVPRNLGACGFSVAQLAAMMEGYGYKGYRLGLMRKMGGYTWSVVPFDVNDRDYDAVWVHSTSQTDSVTLIRGHIPNFTLN